MILDDGDRDNYSDNDSSGDNNNDEDHEEDNSGASNCSEQPRSNNNNNDSNSNHKNEWRRTAAAAATAPLLAEALSRALRSGELIQNFVRTLRGTLTLTVSPTETIAWAKQLIEEEEGIEVEEQRLMYGSWVQLEDGSEEHPNTLQVFHIESESFLELKLRLGGG